ncbi:MAG: FAD-dependent oxidoreductase [Gemmatimonadetes bacterium]|nr:FAD-dependent oxidoreductase [Gemmatimonadota bacterium]
MDSTPLSPTSPLPPDGDDAVGRRDFLKVAGGAGVLLAAGCAPPVAFSKAPARGIERGRGTAGRSTHVVVIGAGAWGGWTAYHLAARGVKVTLIDAYGPGNSKATSGDETRGIRSSYGDRATGELWVPWARSAIARWQLFEQEWGPQFRTKFFHQTGDVIMRATREPFITKTIELWQANKVQHEVLTGDEARKRWPVIKADDITVAITEPDAGVVRCRAATQAVAAIAQKMGASLIVSRATPGPIRNGQMDGVVLEDGRTIRGDAYVFACGAWLRKLFPYMENRVRVPIGHALYFGVPAGDQRFTYPNLPSFNFPGTTGWPVLPVDSRGFRVRGGLAAPAPANAAANAATSAAAPAASGTTAGAAGAAGAARPAQQTTQQPPADPLQNDPDTSSRWTNQDRVDSARRFLAARFPLLANAPVLETHACHYESSVNQNFIIDHVPECTNAWIAGLGQAEGFKFGPVVGDYIAQRVVGIAGDPVLQKAFALPTAQYDAPR